MCARVYCIYVYMYNVLLYFNLGRFGIGRFTTLEEIEYTAKHTIQEVKKLRDMRYNLVDYSINLYLM